MRTKKLLYLIAIIFFSGCTSRVKYVELNQCTVFNKSDSFLKEIYLVTNPPRKLSDFRSFLKKIKLKRNSKYDEHEILFIKEHDNNLMDKLFGDEVDYHSGRCEEINDEDFLCLVRLYINDDGKEVIEYHFYEGDLWYY